MYKKIIKTMIALVISFLTALYIVKIFLPKQFIMAIQNEKLVAIGNYIDNHWWLNEIICFTTSFLTYWLYICAVTKKWKLNWKEIIIVLIVITLTHLLYEYDTQLSSVIPFVSMIIIPALSKANLKEVSIVFSVHCFAQLLSITIRDLPSLLTSVNFMTMFLMTIECYFWLFLFYLYYNYKEI